MYLFPLNYTKPLIVTVIWEKSIPASEAPCVIISPSSLPCSPLIGPLILQASAHPSAC